VERHNAYRDVTKSVARKLKEKYPGITPAIVRSILMASMEVMHKQAINGRTTRFDKRRTFCMYIERKAGYNYVPVAKRGTRAISDVKIGTELCFVFGGTAMRSGLIEGKIGAKIQRELISLANNEKYLNSVL